MCRQFDSSQHHGNPLIFSGFFVFVSVRSGSVQTYRYQDWFSCTLIQDMEPKSLFCLKSVPILGPGEHSPRTLRQCTYNLFLGDCLVRTSFVQRMRPKISAFCSNLSKITLYKPYPRGLYMRNIMEDRNDVQTRFVQRSVLSPNSRTEPTVNSDAFPSDVS